MSKAVIFGSGVITGVVMTPVAIMYVKPFRNAFGKGVSSLLKFGMRISDEYRESVIRGVFTTLDQIENEYKEDFEILRKEYGSNNA